MISLDTVGKVNEVLFKDSSLDSSEVAFEVLLK